MSFPYDMKSVNATGNNAFVTIYKLGTQSGVHSRH